MNYVWAFVALMAIAAAWDSIRRIFWHRGLAALEQRTVAIETELPELRKAAADSEEYARTIKNRMESQSPQQVRSGRWVK